MGAYYCNHIISFSVFPLVFCFTSYFYFNNRYEILFAVTPVGIWPDGFKTMQIMQKMQLLPIQTFCAEPVFITASSCKKCNNSFILAFRLGRPDIPHFPASCLLHDPSCRNHAINAVIPLIRSSLNRMTASKTRIYNTPVTKTMLRCKKI